MTPWEDLPKILCPQWVRNPYLKIQVWLSKKAWLQSKFTKKSVFRWNISKKSPSQKIKYLNWSIYRYQKAPKKSKRTLNQHRNLSLNLKWKRNFNQWKPLTNLNNYSGVYPFFRISDLRNYSKTKKYLFTVLKLDPSVLIAKNHTSIFKIWNTNLDCSLLQLKALKLLKGHPLLTWTWGRNWEGIEFTLGNPPLEKASPFQRILQKNIFNSPKSIHRRNRSIRLVIFRGKPSLGV